MATIRELITEKSEKLRNPEQLTPHEASQELVELSALLSSLNKETAEALYWLNIKSQEFLVEHKSAAKAKIHANASKEWLAWRERVEQQEAVMEMIRALKYFLRNAESEARESSF